MNYLRTLTALPFAALLLAGCTTTRADGNYAPQSANGPNRAGATPVTINTVGYQALKRGDMRVAGNEFRQITMESPNDAFAELNLGAVYQGAGRMDLAEPLYREAITHGHDLMPSDVTQPWAQGLTVEDIACRNLVNGLPAATAAKARTCQSVIAIGITRTSGEVVTEGLNTYFAFNSDELTPAGLANIQTAAKQVMADPTARVALIGHASKLGSSASNYELSERRAKAVANAMIAAGVPSDRISTNWTGENSLPVAQTQTERMPANRVVESKVISGAIGKSAELIVGNHAA